MDGFLSITQFKLPYPFAMDDHHNLIRCLLCGMEHYARDLFRRTNPSYDPLAYDFTKGLVHQKELEDHGDDMSCPSCGARPETTLGRKIINFFIGGSDGFN